MSFVGLVTKEKQKKVPQTHTHVQAHCILRTFIRHPISRAPQHNTHTSTQHVTHTHTSHQPQENPLVSFVGNTENTYVMKQTKTCAAWSARRSTSSSTRKRIRTTVSWASTILALTALLPLTTIMQAMLAAKAAMPKACECKWHKKKLSNWEHRYCLSVCSFILLLCVFANVIHNNDVRRHSWTLKWKMNILECHHHCRCWPLRALRFTQHVYLLSFSARSNPTLLYIPSSLSSQSSRSPL